jgi:predicted Zn-dependent protease
MTRIFGLFATTLLLSAPGMPAQEQDASGPVPEEVSEKKESKAEKERRKKEEKAAQKEAKEAKEAKELLDEIQSDMDEFAKGLIARRYLDSFLQEYVNEMGQNLVPTDAPEGVLFSFRVVADPSPNAYALADGRVFVNAGLLTFVKNEAQLAMVLGHEIGHVVERHTIEAIKESRSVKKKLLPSLLGAAAGAIVGGMFKGKEGAAVGAAAGAVGGALYSAVAMNSYNRKQEDEADTIGARLMLARSYDAAEGVAFFQRLADRFGDKDQFSAFLWANHSRNVDRVKHIRALLDGEMSGAYNARRSEGKLTIGTGQLNLYMSRMYRDVAIALMDHLDRYDLAKELLDSIIEYRARDPRALWAIGRVYKMVGRTPEDKARALEYLQRAAQTDERNLHPYVYRDVGLMQARLANATEGSMAPAIESLKKYVRGTIDKDGIYPPDIEEMYDYLLIFGDSQWTAPKMESVMMRASVPGASPHLKPLGPNATEAAKAMIPGPPPKKKAAAPDPKR